MVKEFLSCSVADLLSVVIRGVEAMSGASVLKQRVDALESTSSSNNTRVG